METIDRLRELLLTPEAAAELDAPGRTDAAVLVPLYVDAGALHAVFTKRRDDLRRHAGEISFPGGRQDSPDEDLRRTALQHSIACITTLSAAAACVEGIRSLREGLHTIAALQEQHAVGERRTA